MKIAITGHSSGIGHQLDLILSLTTKHDIQGYSKSNGWNIAERDGDKIVEELIDFDPDVFFNNAYYPQIQNKILERLMRSGKTKIKLSNTGSISGYPKGILLDDDSDYVNDKKALSNFVLETVLIILGKQD